MSDYCSSTYNRRLSVIPTSKHKMKKSCKCWLQSLFCNARFHASMGRAQTKSAQIMMTDLWPPLPGDHNMWPSRWKGGIGEKIKTRSNAFGNRLNAFESHLNAFAFFIPPAFSSGRSHMINWTNELPHLSSWTKQPLLVRYWLCGLPSQKTYFWLKRG